MKYTPTFNEKEQINTFLDADKVVCVTIEDAKAKYPYLNWEKIEERFSWDISDTDVMALDDLKICLRLKEEGLEIEDVEYTEVEFCSVCGCVILPDEEAYVDVITGEILCDKHARFDEGLNGYVKAI